MCHHVDMAINWDEVVTSDESDAEDLDAADDVSEPAVESEKSTPEVTPPADD